MHKFYHYVNKKSRGEMVWYLSTHFRYNTMNSWNRSTSYACNLKVHSLGLDHEVVDKLYDMLQVKEFYTPLNNLMYEFGEQHDQLWQAIMNGRSGGYLVLCQGNREPSGYKSHCTCCGQHNYRSVSENGNVCGVCRAPARIDYIDTHMRVVRFPGRGTDNNEDFDDWSLGELRRRVALVQEFDKLADAIVCEAVRMTKHYTVEDESYLVEKTRPVLVPARRQ